MKIFQNILTQYVVGVQFVIDKIQFIFHIFYTLFTLYNWVSHCLFLRIKLSECNELDVKQQWRSSDLASAPYLISLKHSKDYVLASSSYFQGN